MKYYAIREVTKRAFDPNKTNGIPVKMVKRRSSSILNHFL